AQRLAQVAETRGEAEKAQAAEAFDPLDAAEPEVAAPAAPVDRGVAARVELALRDDRVDFFLQPVVSLPNRRVTHYEGLSRLREPDGIALPEEFLEVAAAEGHLPEIDRRAVMRGLKVAERLQASGRNIGLFINVSPQTLGDDRALSDFVERIDANPDLARAVTLELAQEAFDGLALAEREARKALTERGVRFSIDHVTDLRLDPRDLERRGVRFVKISAATLLAPDAARGLSIHPSDLANLLARHGVDLIVTHVEDERIVPELLDHDVKAASGHLFGVPRPVRDDAGDGARSDETPRRFAPRPLVVRG
ncbi:EAL domain-containing protein, partial [Methylopila musalis]